MQQLKASSDGAVTAETCREFQTRIVEALKGRKNSCRHSPTSLVDELDVPECTRYFSAGISTRLVTIRYFMGSVIWTAKQAL